MKEFFAYRIQSKPVDSVVLVNSRKLFQQLLVDAYSMIESSRLCFTINN